MPWIPIRRRRSLALIAPLLVLLAAPVAGPDGAAATAQHPEREGSAEPREYSTTPVGRAGAAAWTRDLDALVAGIEAVHPDPYWHTPEPRFDSAVAALRARIPGLAAHEIVVGFARLAAMVGDGHTTLALHAAPGVDFHVLPYRLGVYEGGLFVEAADGRYADLVGGRVTAIGAVAAGEVLDRVTPLISRDNDNWIGAVAPHLLNRMEVLHAVGLAEGLDGVSIAVEVPDTTSGTGGDNGAVERERADGTVRRVEAWVEPLPERHPQPFGLPFLPRLTDDWVDARDVAPRPVPLYQRRFEDVYGWEYLPDDDLLYIKLDQVRNRDHGPAALHVFREALAFGRERRPARTVIDLRNNTGGEGGLLPPIVREIVRSREIDEPGRLFVVIGRRTFSAAQMLVAELQRYTSAILVGEPSSAYYNGYAGHEPVRLPESGVVVMASPDYYQMSHFPRDARRQATPRLAAVPTFDDYRANRDPALAVVRDHAPSTLAEDVLAALEAGDSATAEARVRAYDARPVNRFRNGSAELNALGYRLLRNERVEEALRVFRLNVRVHPDEPNGWDSLGEAYVHAGRREAAIEAFRRALALDPTFAPSRAWLHRLTAPWAAKQDP